MQVTFTRIDQRRYAISFKRDGPRDIGGDLPHWPGPGPADFPHDLVHFLVEEQLGLRLGIFGQVAAGGGLGAFAMVDRSGPTRHRSERLRRAGRPDMRRSEQVVSHVRVDGALHPDADALVGDFFTARALRARLAEVHAQWTQVPIRGSLTLTWPTELTLQHGRTGPQRGRVTAKTR
jgi:hypothetical protein